MDKTCSTCEHWSGVQERYSGHEICTIETEEAHAAVGVCPDCGCIETPPDFTCKSWAERTC